MTLPSPGFVSGVFSAVTFLLLADGMGDAQMPSGLVGWLACFAALLIIVFYSLSIIDLWRKVTRSSTHVNDQIHKELAELRRVIQSFILRQELRNKDFETALWPHRRREDPPGEVPYVP